MAAFRIKAESHAWVDKSCVMVNQPKELAKEINKMC
jgi:hypothetical protein